MNELLGRKVKIISNKYESHHKIGSIGIIVDVCEKQKNFVVDVKGEKWWHELDSVELMCECGEYFKVWLNGENKPVDDWCGECTPF